MLENVSRSNSGLVRTKLVRRDRVHDLPDVELGLLPRVRVEPVSVGHQLAGPTGGQQIGLLEKIEELVLRPFRVGEALVGRGRGGDRLGRLARHLFDRAGPEVEIGAAETGLQFERALRIRQPVFRDVADRLHRIGDTVREIGLEFAFLARRHIGGERLAALLDQAREVAREGLDIGGAEFRLYWRLLKLHRRPTAKHGERTGQPQL